MCIRDSFDAARMLAARWKREISLEYLTEEKFVQLSTTDEYFHCLLYTSPILFDGKNFREENAGATRQAAKDIVNSKHD